MARRRGAARHRGAGGTSIGFAIQVVTSAMTDTALAPELLAMALGQRIAGSEDTGDGRLPGVLPMGLVLRARPPLPPDRPGPPAVTASPEGREWVQRRLVAMGQLARHEVAVGVRDAAGTPRSPSRA